MEKIYEIRNSDNTETYYLIRKEDLSEIGEFKSLTQGLDLIVYVFDKAKQQKRTLQEYQGIFECLQEIFAIFTLGYPMFLEEELKGKNVLYEVSKITEKGWELVRAIDGRILWHSQKTIGPFCFKEVFEKIEIIGIQLKEDSPPAYFQELFTAENFLKHELDEKEINQETYEILDKQLRKIFSEISSN